MSLDDLLDTVEELNRMGGRLQAGLGYHPPPPKDDDPRWDKNDEHPGDDAIRERRERDIESAESILEDR